MLDKLLNAIENECPLDHLSDILSAYKYLMSHFQQQYFKDGNARDAAIDVMIEILQKEKSIKIQN